MTRKALIEQTFESIKKLPDHKLKEVSDYVDFLLNRIESKNFNHELTRLASQGGSFDFLDDEEELYNESDLKEVYQ